jgi:MFS family permease
MAFLRSRGSDNHSYKWVVIAMLWFVCFFNYADRLAIFSVFPLIKNEFRLTDVQLSILASSFMWMYALFGPFAGWLSDRFPRKTLVLGALIFWSIVTAATALTHSFAALLVCRALGGLGEAFYFPAAMSLISDYHGPSTRSRAMSLHQSSVYAGSIAGAALSGLMGESYGWRSSFVLFGAIGIGLGLLLWMFLREPVRGMAEPLAQTAPDPHAGGSILEGFREVFENPMVLLLVTVFMAANFVAVVFLTWMPTFLMAGFNATAYLQVASVLGVLSGGLLADRLRRTNPGGRLMAQGIGLLCGVPFIFITGWTIKVPVLLLGMIGFGYFKGLYDANIFAGLYDVVPVQRRGAAAGILNSLGWLGAGFAPVLIALGAARFGLSACLSATASIYLAISLLLFWGARSVASAANSRVVSEVTP